MPEPGRGRNAKPLAAATLHRLLRCGIDRIGSDVFAKGTMDKNEGSLEARDIARQKLRNDATQRGFGIKVTVVSQLPCYFRQ